MAGDVDARRIDDRRRSRRTGSRRASTRRCPCRRRPSRRFATASPRSSRRRAMTAGRPMPSSFSAMRDDRRVVDVRVEVVVVLERPAAGLDAGELDRPVSARPDLLLEEPLAAFWSAGSSAAHSRGPKRDEREAGVPDGRLARLGPKAVAVVDHEPLPALDPAPEVRRLGPVAAAGEGDQRPDPRRLDPAPGAVELLPVDSQRSA